MRLVIDGSVALKWVLSPVLEPDAVVASRILQQARSAAHSLFAPPHWLAEVLSVVARKTPDRTADTIEIIFGLAAHTVGGRPTHEHATRLAILLNQHLFDTLYHAVAIEMNATLVTADEGYFEKAQQLGHIMRLAEFRSN